MSFLRIPFSPLYFYSSFSSFIFRTPKFYSMFVQVCQENRIKLGNPNTLCRFFASQLLVLGSDGYPLPNSSSNSTIDNELPKFYTNFHPSMTLSLVTFAHTLDALTTLWSWSAFGWTVIFLVMFKYYGMRDRMYSLYLFGSPTVSTYTSVTLNPWLSALLNSLIAALCEIVFKFIESNLCCFRERVSADITSTSKKNSVLLYFFITSNSIYLYSYFKALLSSNPSSANFSL